MTWVVDVTEDEHGHIFSSSSLFEQVELILLSLSISCILVILFIMAGKFVSQTWVVFLARSTIRYRHGWNFDCQKESSFLLDGNAG
jgi:hypothetical protein